ncbi:hypothetical protein HELRODRAFT_188530 [Helobdella robusta]|uniref:EGF-like domain-containing protein n=1 Tax=Helobdella robusta TaxID=6412 RepID=T1FQ35_HELRO|nr:hypothetical protein HELRODRAFT_188530 [Helobdella robusta]ESO01956.1 hypothetical protein HELRODRAFT_188530 [Helobdella robusta]
MSGSVYWTDSSHNWIMVASSSAANVYKRLVYTKLDKPTGIAVHPHLGFLYWSSSGALPKIERSNLDGSNRIVFISKDLTEPQGVTIDYDNSLLYWVDGWTSLLQCADARTGQNMLSYFIQSPYFFFSALYDAAIYKGLILITDQLQCIILTNLTSRTFKLHPIKSYVPYDVVVISPDNQPTYDFSTCASLNCPDICVSDGNGTYHCICREGSKMLEDNNTCVVYSRPDATNFIYSTDSQICLYDVLRSVASPECVISPESSLPSALAFNYYSSRLFVSDVESGSTYRMITDFDNPVNSLVGTNKKKISGLSVDWLGDNLYQTDTEAGTISVSKLDGRYPVVLLKNLLRPWDIEVNPLSGLMYWSSEGTVYVSNMDGTVVQTCFMLTAASLKGLSIDIQNNALYVADQSLPGIWMTSLDCDSHKKVIQLDKNTKIDDVIIINDVLMWVNGTNIVGMAERVADSFNFLPSPVINDNVNQIVSYGYNMQPMSSDSGDLLNPCVDFGGNSSCGQLCLLRPNQETTCACSAGFSLVHYTECVSDLLSDDFLLLVDPISKEGYQIPLGNELQDDNDKTFYWLDVVQLDLPFYNDISSGATIKSKSVDDRLREVNVLTIKKSIKPTKIDLISDIHTLIYDDDDSGHLHGYDLVGNLAWIFEDVEGLKGGIYALNSRTMDFYWLDSRTSSIKKVRLSEYKRKFEDEIPTNDTDPNNLTATTTFDSTTETTSNVETLMHWSKDPIKGLSLSINSGEMLVIWTFNHIYICKESEVVLHKKFENTNLTSVLFSDSIIYFTTWNENSVYRFDTNSKKLGNLFAGVFNRIVDMRGFQNEDQTWNVDQNSSKAGKQRNDGLIAGLVVGFFLVLVLSVFAFFMWRRKRKTEIIERYYSTMVTEQEQQIVNENGTSNENILDRQHGPYNYNQQKIDNSSYGTQTHQTIGGPSFVGGKGEQAVKGDLEDVRIVYDGDSNKNGQDPIGRSGDEQSSRFAEIDITKLSSYA